MSISSAAAWVALAAAEFSQPPRHYVGGDLPPPRDTRPITLAERNKRINAAAAKSRKNAKRKAAEKQRRVRK